jgi:translation elongation factor P/translation initiation factor 5A
VPRVRTAPVSASCVPGHGILEGATTDDLQPGDWLKRAGGWWVITAARTATPRLGGPVVRLRARDDDGTVRELSLPAGLSVTVLRPAP